MNDKLLASEHAKQLLVLQKDNLIESIYSWRSFLSIFSIKSQAKNEAFSFFGFTCGLY
jgi:hypothetical protein